MNGCMKMTNNPMEIYIADIPFEDSKSSKVRPALVMQIGQKNVGVFKITSKYQNKSSQIKRFYYPIKEWQAAGLRKQSYVDTHHIFNLPRNIVFKYKPIGKLTSNDIVNLFEFIQTNLDINK